MITDKVLELAKNAQLKIVDKGDVIEGKWLSDGHTAFSLDKATQRTTHFREINTRISAVVAELKANL